MRTTERRRKSHFDWQYRRYGKGKRKSKKIRFPIEQIDAITYIAMEEGITFTDFVNHVCAHALNEFEKRKQDQKILCEAPTNMGLLNICLEVLDGKWCDWDDPRVTETQILEICVRCSAYIYRLDSRFRYCVPDRNGRCMVSCTEEDQRCLTERQIYCLCVANEHIIEGNYVQALHKFMDGIDDYGAVQKQDRPVSMAEYAMYQCVLNAFILRLKDFKNVDNY